MKMGSSELKSHPGPWTPLLHTWGSDAPPSGSRSPHGVELFFLLSQSLQSAEMAATSVSPHRIIVLLQKSNSLAKDFRMAVKLI